MQRACDAYHARVCGYYIVNRETDLAVAGPYKDPAEAQLEASRRNRMPLAKPGVLEVRLIGPSKVPDF